MLLLVIIAGGVGARALFEPSDEAVKRSAAESAAANAPIAARAEKKFDKPAAPGANARLELAVAPWGEVFVDGKSRGVSPPLRSLELAPGAHTVEIRNSTFPVHVQHVQLKPGEAVKIRHRFR
jgi:hypothetical protein